MSRHNKDRSLEWGSVNRSSNKLGIPNRAEGRDGDIQVRQTNLGAKLYGKIGGRWNSTFLSSEDQIIGTSGTKIGMDSSGTFTVTGINLDGNMSISGKIVLTSTGTRNICIGTGNNDIGEDNIIIGATAGNSLLSDSSYNIFIGSRAGRDVTSATNNVLVGFEAGMEVTTGNSNICIGSGAGEGIDVHIGNIGIGNNAFSNPTDGNTAATDNVCIGHGSGSIISIGAGNTCLGDNAGYSTSGGGAYLTTGSFNTCLGYNATVGSAGDSNSIPIGKNAVGHGSNICTIGNADLTAIHPADNDGVNLGSASYQFHNLYYGGALVSSDLRVKEDISSLALGLEFINRLNPVSFKKKNAKEVYDGDKLIQRAVIHKRKHNGLIAQEVKQVMDDMGIDSNDFSGYADANIEEGVDKLFLNYTEFTAPIIKAVQELSAKLDTMQEEINNLKTE